jgi:hypothetical protein
MLANLTSAHVRSSFLQTAPVAVSPSPCTAPRQGRGILSAIAQLSVLLPLLALAAVPAVLVFFPGALLAFGLFLPVLLPVLLVLGSLLAPATTPPQAPADMGGAAAGSATSAQ